MSKYTVFFEPASTGISAHVPDFPGCAAAAAGISCVGSGVMEAGCKTVTGQRLKPSAMFRTVVGANAINTLRRCYDNGTVASYWERRAA